MSFWPTDDMDLLIRHFEELAGDVCQSLRKMGKLGKCVTIVVKYKDFRFKQRQKAIGSYISSSKEIMGVCLDLLKNEKLEDAVRGLSVRLGDLIDEKDVPKDTRISNFFGRVVTKNQDKPKIGQERQKMTEDICQKKEFLSKPLDDKSSSGILDGAKTNIHNISYQGEIVVDVENKDDSNMVGEKFESKDFIQDVFVCPICNTKFPSFSNHSYTNRHIDNCLKNKENQNIETSVIELHNDKKRRTGADSQSTSHNQKRVKPNQRDAKNNQPVDKKASLNQITNFFNVQK